MLQLLGRQQTLGGVIEAYFVLKVEKKLSTTALSQQQPLADILQLI
jgi:hypothetical protein